MLLYYCPTCGYWADKAVRDATEKFAADFKDGLIRAMGTLPPEREPLPNLSCPDGHGELVMVKSTDRIYVRSDVVESVAMTESEILARLAEGKSIVTSDQYYHTMISMEDGKIVARSFSTDDEARTEAFTGSLIEVLLWVIGEYKWEVILF